MGTARVGLGAGRPRPRSCAPAVTRGAGLTRRWMKWRRTGGSETHAPPDYNNSQATFIVKLLMRQRMLARRCGYTLPITG